LRAEERLNAIQKELAEIRIALSFPQSPRFVKLKGSWKGLRVNGHDVADAKRSLFRDPPNKLFHVTVAREKNPKGNVPKMGVLHRYSAERGLT
jgi:hypothetical protein